MVSGMIWSTCEGGGRDEGGGKCRCVHGGRKERREGGREGECMLSGKAVCKAVFCSHSNL